jgi:hypothetical protein
MSQAHRILTAMACAFDEIAAGYDHQGGDAIARGFRRASEACRSEAGIVARGAEGGNGDDPPDDPPTSDIPPG